MAPPIRAWPASRLIARLFVTFKISRRPPPHRSRGLFAATVSTPTNSALPIAPTLRLTTRPPLARARPAHQVDSCARVRPFPPSLLSTVASTCTPTGAAAATLAAAPAGPGAPADAAGLFHAALLCPAGITFHLVAKSSWQIPPPQRAQRCGRSPRVSPARITPARSPSTKKFRRLRAWHPAPRAC